MASDSAEDQENFVRGFHGIPDKEKLSAMSFSELAAELSSCEKDSPKFHIVERELKKHLAKDQAKINLPNILIGAGIAGFFTIVGALVGGYLKTCPSCQQVAPTDTVQQIEKSNLGVQPPSGNVPTIVVPPVVQPPPHPADVRKNAHPGNKP